MFSTRHIVVRPDGTAREKAGRKGYAGREPTAFADRTRVSAFGAAAAALRAVPAQRSRWPLWLPVALGAGVSAYFALPDEPPIWSGPAAAALTGAVGWAGRRREAVFWLALLGLAGALGMTLATVRTAVVDTPMLDRPTWADITGTVVRVERRPGDWRLTLDKVRLAETRRGIAVPETVRLVVRTQDQVPGLGARIRARGRLMPPQRPATPGGFDFRRWAYFTGLGAVGFAVGEIVVVSPAETTGGRLAVDRLRGTIAERVREAIPGPAGAVAAALLVGDRSGLEAETVEVFRASGLAHLLAISGLHMGMVAGMLFVSTRFVLSCVPMLALRHPIKKWAAVVALAGSGAYLLLAGAPVPTQRAFLMTGLVLVAVLLDREAVTLRLVAWAACVVLVLAPETLMGPSFQLSFAAVTALVAVYEAWRDRKNRSFPIGAAGHSLVRRAGTYVVGVMSTSLIAGVATAPFTAFHFQTVAHGGLLANILAVPLTGFVTMPAGLAAAGLMVFGADTPALWVMQAGINATLAVGSVTVDVLGPPLAVPPVPGMAVWILVIGGCWWAIWRGWPRWLGLAPVLAALAVWSSSHQPDALISADGRVIAVAVGDGNWVRAPSGVGSFALKDWTERWAMRSVAPFAIGERTHADRVACDDLGCVIRRHGRDVSVVFSPEAAMEDCRLADILITPVKLRRACVGPAEVIDASALRHGGGHAVWLTETTIKVRTVNSLRGDRPWTR